MNWLPDPNAQLSPAVECACLWLLVIIAVSMFIAVLATIFGKESE